MGRTLLVGHPDFTWREWLKGRDFVCLDPADADHGPACRVFAFESGKVRWWRFVGSTDPARNPIALVASALSAGSAPGPQIFEMFALRPSPVVRQLALEIAQALRPDEVLVPQNSGLESLPWPVGAQPVESAAAFPRVVVEAQRRARWLELLESGETHVVDLAQVPVIGARLGSGVRGQEEGWVEACGPVLHVVRDTEPDPDTVASLMDRHHCTRLSFVTPQSYVGLACSLADSLGEDIGQGIIEKFEPEANTMTLRATAVAPAPVRLLKLGSLRIDSSGRELPELKPWQL